MNCSGSRGLSRTICDDENFTLSPSSLWITTGSLSRTPVNFEPFFPVTRTHRRSPVPNLEKRTLTRSPAFSSPSGLYRRSRTKGGRSRQSAFLEIRDRRAPMGARHREEGLEIYRRSRQ